MNHRMGGKSAGRLAILAIAGTVFGTGLVTAAQANNLDARTAQNSAREVARRECRDTTGCTGFKVINLNRVSRHKAVGKIAVTSTKNGVPFVCTQQVVIKLDHFDGQVRFALSQRRCV